jgi:hypothetical protein
MPVKIVNHCFHGFYLFDYLEKEFENSPPKYLYADWPIIDCVPKTKENEGGSGFVKFTDIKELRDVIYPDESEESKKDPLKNYITVKLQDLSKFRALFHNLIKSHGFDHKFNLTIEGETKGPIERTCCIPTPISFMAEYKKETGGHCCDNAIFSFSAGGKKLGTINLNNASDCGSRSSGPFNLSKEEVEKALVDEYIEVEIESQQEQAHDSVTAMEVKDTQSGTVIANVGVSRGVSQVPACSRPDDDYSDTLCCCPPKFRKTDATTGKSSSSIAKGYECDRKHSKKITGELKIDTGKIFEEATLKNRISPYIINAYYGSIGDDSSSSSGSSSSLSSGKQQTLHVNSLIIYKEDWKFDEKEFKKLFQASSSSSNTKAGSSGATKFPLGSTYINDPIMSPLYQHSEEVDSKLVRFLYEIKDGVPDKENNQNFLTSKRDFTSSHLGTASLKTDQSNLGNAVDDTTRYTILYSLWKPLYIESKKEYIFYIDVESNVKSNDNNAVWNAGDFEPAAIKSKDGKKFYESFPLKYKLKDSKTSKKSPLMDLGQCLSTSKIKTIIEDGSLESEAEKKLKKLQLPFLIKTDSGEEKLTFECLRFNTQSLVAKHNRSSSSSSSDEQRTCIDGTVTANWNLDDFKFRVNGWLEDDFSEQATFPPTVV